MTLQACAELLQKGDPDRFRAAMAAPPEARKVLFPLWAFNLEVARAPWLTEEPLIAEMRLQWWRDALDEIAAGGPVRRHEVATPLGTALGAEEAACLVDLIEARRLDIGGEPFPDLDALKRYIDRTAGHLTWAGMRALGTDPRAEAPARDFAFGSGLARYFKAVPDLVARGRAPFPTGTDAPALVALAESGTERLNHGAFLRHALGKVRFAPLLDGWMAGVTLRRAATDPARIETGALRSSPFRERLGLILFANAKRWRRGTYSLDAPPEA